MARKNSYTHRSTEQFKQPSVNRNEELQENSNSALIFPLDMEKEFYPEAIKFSIYERHGVSYEETKKIVKNAFQSGLNFIKADHALSKSYRELDSGDFVGSVNANSQQKSAIKAAKNFKEESRVELFGKPGGISIENGNIVLNEGKKSVTDKLMGQLDKAREEQSLEKTLERHLQSIYLAMPQSVNFAEGIDWQGTDLGVVGGLKSGALGMDNALDYGVLTGAGAALGGAAGLGASMIPGISGIAGTVLGAVLGNNSLQSGIESTFGVKTNPFKEQTFQGVGFRPFDFSFNFRARSQSDVLVIRDIIGAFRSYSKPTFKEGSHGAIFKYPKEFRIEFLTIDDNNTYVTNEYLPEIKFCICTAVNTNFTAQGWRTFKDGAPTDITLQMTFQETEIVTGEDVNGDTDVGRFAGEGGNF